MRQLHLCTAATCMEVWRALSVLHASVCMMQNGASICVTMHNSCNA